MGYRATSAAAGAWGKHMRTAEAEYCACIPNDPIRVPAGHGGSPNESRTPTIQLKAHADMNSEPPTNPTSPARASLTNEQWTQLLRADGTARALPFQRSYVRGTVGLVTGTRPTLKGLTVGQAERILEALGDEPEALHRSGRDNRGWNRAGQISLLACVTVTMSMVLPVTVLGLIAFGAAIGWVAYIRLASRRARLDSTSRTNLVHR